MKSIKIIISLLLLTSTVYSNETDTLKNNFNNSSEQLLSNKPGLQIGGYGEVHFNQGLTENIKDLSTLDVHRIVMFFGYNFSKNTKFISEIEMEYTKELWVEQAFLQQRINKYIDFRAGLLLVPMGIINEYHEPTTFNGVERPIIDNKIAPSTWREVGVGFSGNIQEAFIKYQAYLINGFNGYDTKGILTGSQPLREGRQKGSKSYMSSLNYTAKVEFYGLKNLNLGLSSYFGKSQSKLYNNLHKDSTLKNLKADSSIVGLAMIGVDARYNIKGVRFAGQLYYTQLSNTEKYNKFTSKAGKPNDLGKSLLGYYAEIGYNVFQPFDNIKYELIPFVRYEFYDTHNKVDNLVKKNELYNNSMITGGFTFKLNKGAVIKTDIQFYKNKSETKYNKTINAGIGVMF